MISIWKHSKTPRIVLILRNEKPSKTNKSYTITTSGYTILSTPDNIIQLKKLYKGSKTLHDLGFTVKVGNVVWNQCKKELTDDSDKTLLVYSSDITEDHKLMIKEYSNKDKKII